MALSKKHSRLITVDNQRFRWLVSPNDGYCIFIAEKEEVNGQKIEVYFDTDINNFWLSFPDVEHLNLKVLYPKDAAPIIGQALKDGWKPDKKGSPLVFDWKDNKIIKREAR
ncbi:MAG: hypothetical protein AB8H12_03210 [Lewinella sp.]